MVTLAYLGPLVGVHAASSTFCGPLGSWGCCAAAGESGFFTAASTWSTVSPSLACAIAVERITGARGQPGSSFLHLATLPCGQPQSHGFSFMTLSTTYFCCG